MMIVNDDSRIITKLETSLTGDARVVIYDRHMFIVLMAGSVKAKAVFTLAKFSAKSSSLLALATLGSVTQIEMILSVSYCQSWPRQVQ